MRSHRVVLVFARTPAAEARAKPFGDRRRAARLHAALLARTLHTARAAGADVELASRQSGDSFGERLEHAVAGAFAAGWREVVVVGADAPALTPRHLCEAFAALAGDGPRAALGPAHDGGYYLLALNTFATAPFRGVPFHSGRAFAATAAALSAARFALAILAPLGDVDDRADLRALAGGSNLVARLARELLGAAAPRPRSVSPAHRRRRAACVDARGPPLPSIPTAA